MEDLPPFEFNEAGEVKLAPGELYCRWVVDPAASRAPRRSGSRASRTSRTTSRSTSSTGSRPRLRAASPARTPSRRTMMQLNSTTASTASPSALAMTASCRLLPRNGRRRPLPPFLPCPRASGATKLW
nr:uncharacterized protein CTRU02_11915 [Colletotrichum truncatum]KAF6785290.1 hypothetical protein CTRU02_11915 [Colletotrichum truncatum]